MILRYSSRKNNQTFMIHLKIPLCPSVNKAYAGFKIRHKSNDYKKWEILAWNSLKTQTKYSISWDSWLSATYILWIDLHCKNGNKRVIDCANYEKLTSDFLSHNIEWFKDHKLLSVHIMKKQKTGGEDIMEILIDEIWN